jgi:hypothetical protein
MSDLRPKKPTIILGEKEYPMLFSLNVIDEIQDHFDVPISQLTELLKDERNAFKSVKFILAQLINEGFADEESDETVTERFIGRKITTQNIKEITIAILKAFSGSIPETDEEEIPNSKSE